MFILTVEEIFKEYQQRNNLSDSEMEEYLEKHYQEMKEWAKETGWDSPPVGKELL